MSRIESFLCISNGLWLEEIVIVLFIGIALYYVQIIRHQFGNEYFVMHKPKLRAEYPNIAINVSM